MGKIREGVNDFIIGAVAWYSIILGTMFYPALVFGCVVGGAIEDVFWGLIFFVFGIIIIGFLAKHRCWFILIVIYLITLYPFIQIVHWIYNSPSESNVTAIEWYSPLPYDYYDY